MNVESGQFVVDETMCNRCGLCVNDCPVRIIGLDGFGFHGGACVSIAKATWRRTSLSASFPRLRMHPPGVMHVR